MVKLPESLSVKRNKEAEELLVSKARDWITHDERAPGIHASDLLDPRLAYWQRKDPKPIPDQLVNTFLVGRVLHAFVLGAVDGPSGIDINSSDEGSSISEELGIAFSPDKILDGIVRELKTSRSFYPPKDVADLSMYLEQVLVYMCATHTTEAQLWILYLNLRDENGKTSPTFRCYTVRISSDDLAACVASLRAIRDDLVGALATNEYRKLTLCREFKCGARNCGWYEQCQPEGRYGDPKWDTGNVRTTPVEPGTAKASPRRKVPR